LIPLNLRPSRASRYGAHTDGSAARDRARDEYVGEHGYETISLKRKDRGYQEEVKRLVERIDIAMQSRTSGRLP
jgi:very-short-patch-repair endonuclease